MLGEFDMFYEITKDSVAIGTEDNNIAIPMMAIYAAVARREWTLLEKNWFSGEEVYVAMSVEKEKVSSCDQLITISWEIRRGGQCTMSNVYHLKGLPSGEIVEVDCD